MSLHNPTGMYLIQNGWIGDFPCFWKANSRGYSCVISDAKRWTKSDAEHQIKASAGSHSLRMIPESDVLSAAVTVCDSEKLPR